MVDKLKMILQILRILIILTVGLSAIMIILGKFSLLTILFVIVVVLVVAATIVISILNSITETDGAEEKQNAYRDYLIDELMRDTSQELTFKADEESMKILGIDEKSFEDEIRDPLGMMPKKARKHSSIKYANSNYVPEDREYTDIKIANKKDIIALMLKNNDEITEYFTISKKQVKSSFLLSVIASIIGIIIMGATMYGTIVLDNLQLGIIGLISGAIVEVLSGTVFWIHNKSTLQLNHYYDALHQNEKFLSAVNVADKLSDENREEMYMEIIRKQIDIDD